MKTITVIKQDYLGQETWRYAGSLVKRIPHEIVIQAEFDRDDTPLERIILRRGDQFIETYYDNRWYNIFEIHEGDSDHIKGWYCNIGYPATINGNTIAYRDLALDLLVYPDGRQLVLDEDEFSTLRVTHEVRVAAHKALRELQVLFDDTIKRT